MHLILQKNTEIQSLLRHLLPEVVLATVNYHHTLLIFPFLVLFLVSPFFVVISEDYTFKAIAKRKTFDGLQRQGRIMHLSELQVKNVTAVGTLFQTIDLILQ